MIHHRKQRKGRFSSLGFLWLFSFGALIACWEPIFSGELYDPKPAPEFEAKTLEGGNLSLKDFKGKVVLLEFWRRECSPCMQSMAEVEALEAKASKDELVILGINCDKEPHVLKNFLRRKKVDWPQIHAYSQTENPIELFEIEDLPAFCIIDPEGSVIYRGSKVKFSQVREVLAPWLSFDVLSLKSEGEGLE